MSAELDFNAEVVGPWVAARTKGSWTPYRGTAIGLRVGGELVAGALYEDWNTVNIVSHFAAEGNWAVHRKFLRHIFDYPFRQLKVKRITCPVAESNMITRQFIEKLGFEFEFMLQDAHPDGGIILYKMTPENCRWLNLRSPDHG